MIFKYSGYQLSLVTRTTGSRCGSGELLPIAESFDHAGETNERRGFDLKSMSTERDGAAHGRSFMRCAIPAKAGIQSN